jgi:hypothetical protein
MHKARPMSKGISRVLQKDHKPQPGHNGKMGEGKHSSSDWTRGRTGKTPVRA